MRIARGAVAAFFAFGLSWGVLHAVAPLTPSPLAGSSASSVPSSGGGPLTGRAARSVLKTARASVQSGRLADALRQYEKVIASAPAADEARAEALYWAGFLRMSTDPALRDIDRARAYLGELKVFHGSSGHQDEAGILLALTEEAGDTSRAAQSLRTELAARARETDACRAEKDAVSGRLQTALGENETLKESDAARRAEIQGLRDEVRRKDEALRKVKEVVVGWKAPR